LDGNLTLAHGYLGLMKFFLGRARETRFHISQAMRLSTRDPPLFHWHFFIGVADLYLGRMGSALESLRKSVEINPNWGSPNSSWPAPWRSRGYPQKPPRSVPPPVASCRTSQSPSSAPKR
jgi:hypothetical protein